MHPHLVDWFRNVHINPDLKAVEKRWSTAQEYSTTLSRVSVPRLLRLFLFAKPDPGEISWFTEALLRLDKEFPVTNNVEELRLMAGVVMVTTFADRSRPANAFALGLRVAQMAGRTVDPVQPEILAEADQYLRAETERLRPAEFGRGRLSDPGVTLSAHAVSAGAEENQLAAGGDDQAVNTLRDEHRYLTSETRRLAEETGMLWWILTEYSPSLDCPTSNLTPPEYALVAAAEAADRTQLVPPPLSASALVTRALRSCKKGPKKTLTIANFLAKTNPTWRDARLRQIGCIDFPYLVPVTTALARIQEIDNAAQAAHVAAKLCPGMVAEHPLSPSEIAYLFYCELMFFKALSALEG